MTRIDSITLSDALPEIFGPIADSRQIVDSHVWRTDLRLVRPQHYLIEAASGTGKSSLCSYIYGQRRDYTGTILFNDTDIRSYGIDDWCRVRRSHLALLPQEMRLFPELTVRDNLLLKNRLTDALSEEQIRQMLDEFGLLHKYDQPARLLSIGQQQRVAIVRALCQPFDFILLDEPVSHLDADNNRIAAGMIARAAAQNQAAVISTSVGNPLLLDVSSKLML